MIVRISKQEYVDLFFVYGLAIFAVLVLSFSSLFSQKQPPVTVSVKPAEEVSMFNKEAFKDVRIRGKAYAIYDITNHQVIASHNGTTILPLASITKVMTAVSATLHTTEPLSVAISDDVIEDGYDLGLIKNQSWLLPELLKYTLIFSSNDGAQAIAKAFGGRSVFINQMNEDARVLNLQLIFTDEAGRDVAGKIGGQGSAIEAAKLFGVARKMIPDILDATTKTRQSVISSKGVISGVPNTNQDIENIPGAEGSKTGYTDLAGGNLGVIVDIALGRPVVIVVLGSTKEGRFSDVEILYQALRKSINHN